MRVKRWGLTCGAVLVALATSISCLLPVQAQQGALTGYISPDFCAALVIHPERIEQSPLATKLKAALPKQAATDPNAALAMLGSSAKLPPGLDVAKLTAALDGKKVRRVVLLVDPLPAPGVPASPAVIVQFDADVDGQAILAALGNQWQAAEAHGRKYQKMKNPESGKPDIALCAADARTVLGGFEPSLVKMLVKDQGSQPLVEQLRKTSLHNDIILEFLAAPLLAKLGDAGLAALGEQAAIAKETKSLSATINVSSGALLHVELVTTQEPMAAQLAMMANMGVAAGKAQFEGLKKEPPPFVPPPLLPLLTKLGDEIFAGLTVKNEGARLVVDLPMPASLPDVITAAGQIMAAMAPPK